MPSEFSLSKFFQPNDISFKDIFDSNSIIEDGIQIMPKKKFTEYFTTLKCVPITDDEAEIFYQIASKNGRIEIEDFLQFEQILKSDHCEYEILFQLMNSDLKNVSDFMKRTNLKNVEKFGRFNLQNYLDFTQFIKFVRQEKLTNLKDHSKISIEDTKELFFGNNFRHNLQLHFESVTFPELLAISSVYSKMDTVRNILEKINGAITKSSFAQEANKNLLFTSFSPLEIDVLFRLAGGLQTTLNLQTFLPLINPSYREIDPKDHSHPKVKLTASMELFKGIYNFTLGSLAGAVGAAAVYPIDLVKTRMQNQRAVVGQILYKNSFDCFKKVVKLEGVLGLYSGLAPQLVGGI
jgi:solute carrier family 25 aspartate/glutamate transporter 12/13